MNDEEDGFALTNKEYQGLRDKFAMAALTGMLACSGPDEPYPEAGVAAGLAYNYAEAMLAERER